MTKTLIPVEESFDAWRKDPEYVKAYDALKDEFSLTDGMSEPTTPRPHPGRHRKLRPRRV
jgi:hypothetical protein